MRDVVERRRPMRRSRRWVVAGLVLFGVVATAMAAASIIPPGGTEMPDVLWVAGLVKGADDDALRFRVDSPDGVEFVEPRVHSTWGKTDEAPTGVSVRHALHGWAKARAHLASCGVLPYAELAAAGYDATKRTQTIDGVEWREFRKFDDHFNSWSMGWWLEFERLW
jgi:hypothetical protein